MTTDITARFGGWSLEGQFVWMRDAAGAPIPEWSLGGNFQVAAFITPKVETFAEACWMETADVPWIAQAGINWYVQGVRLKFKGHRAIWRRPNQRHRRSCRGSWNFERKQQLQFHFAGAGDVLGLKPDSRAETSPAI